MNNLKILCVGKGTLPVASQAGPRAGLGAGAGFTRAGASTEAGKLSELLTQCRSAALAAGWPGEQEGLYLVLHKQTDLSSDPKEAVTAIQTVASLNGKLPLPEVITREVTVEGTGSIQYQ